MHYVQILVPRPDLDCMFELLSFTLLDFISYNILDSRLFGWVAFALFFFARWHYTCDGMVKACLYFLDLSEGLILTKEEYVCMAKFFLVNFVECFWLGFASWK